jgi:signal transduction histidine kinase
VIQVEIIEIENQEFLEVSVIDTGIGIPYED